MNITTEHFQKAISAIQKIYAEKPRTDEHYGKVEDVVKPILNAVKPQLRFESYRWIQRSVYSIAHPFYEGDIVNLLKGLTFFSFTFFKQEEYLKLGEYYKNDQLAEANSFAKSHGLNPTYAHTVNGSHTDTALTTAAIFGKLETLKDLAPKVDVNFCLSCIRPAIVTALFSNEINAEKKLKVFDLLIKEKANPLVRRQAGWWLSYSWEQCLCLYGERTEPSVDPYLLSYLFENTNNFLSKCSSKNRNLTDEFEDLDPRNLFDSFAESHRDIQRYNPGYEKAHHDYFMVLLCHGLKIPREWYRTLYRLDYSRETVSKLKFSQDAVEKVYEEELKKEEALQKDYIASSQMLSTMITVKPLCGIVLSYLMLSGKGFQVQLARPMLRHFFGEKTPKPTPQAPSQSASSSQPTSQSTSSSQAPSQSAPPPQPTSQRASSQGYIINQRICTRSRYR